MYWYERCYIKRVLFFRGVYYVADRLLVEDMCHVVQEEW